MKCTHLRDTLKSVKVPTKRKNVTLSLPEPLVRRFRVYAAAQNKSMTSLAATAIEKFIEQDSDRSKAIARMLERMRNAPDRGTRGKITWTRDEINERRVY